MKTIFAGLIYLATAQDPAACTTTNVAVGDAACTCGTGEAGGCAAGNFCLVGANSVAICNTAAVTLEACSDLTGANAVTAQCACIETVPTDLTKVEICAKDELCTATADSGKMCTTAASDTNTDSDATMIGSFAAVMTTTMLSF